MEHNKPLIPVEEQFRIMANSAPVLIWISGTDKLCYFFNDGWLRFTGRTPEQESGNGWAEGVHPDDIERCIKIYTGSFDARKEFRMEYRLRRHDGMYRWIVDHGVPRYTPSGDFAGYIGSCMDIDEILGSERVKQELINEELALKKSLNEELGAKVADRVAELSRSEERFRALVNATSDVVYSLSADWEIMRELDGRGFLKDTQEPMTGWRFRNVHPDDLEEVNIAIAAAIREKKTFQMEHRVWRADDTPGWAFSRAVPILGDHGEIMEWFGAASDITERKLAEDLLQETISQLEAKNEELLSTQAELKRNTNEKQAAINRLNASEQNLRNMVRQAPVGMCIVEGDPMYMTEMNESFLEIIGRTREQATSKPYWEVIPEAKSFYKPITDDVISTGKTYRAYEHEIMLLRNGEAEVVYIDFVYEPMTDAEGKAYAIMIVAIDVTDKVLAMRKVEHAEENLRMAVDAANLATFSINVVDRIFYPSPKLKEFFGFRHDEEVPYNAALDQIHADHRQAVADMVEAAITKGAKYDIEYPIVGHNDQKMRWVRAIGKVQQDEQGVNRYFTGVLHEITEQKLIEIRKNDFIAMASHELKTPITSMNAYLQILQAKFENSQDEFVAMALQNSLKQIRKMMSLINGFLNVSRLEAGKVNLNKQSFDIAGLIGEIKVENELINASHNFIYNTMENTIINGDREKIGQVISNLISNAVKYSKAGSTIEISCINLNHKIQVSIKDEGIGVDPKDAAKLFQRYYRVHDTNHISGFGIGLYLSAEIIGLHNGSIWVESEPGKGSMFHFTLPL
jgi:PAS domain S-box-containing protein